MTPRRDGAYLMANGWWILKTGLLAMLVAACASSPLGRSQLNLIPESQMKSMGKEAFANLQEETPVVTDPAVKDYVRCISDAIIEQLPKPEAETWEVAVFDKDMVNAFALPGGYIGIYRGLLGVAESADQLAAVIGHEVGHVIANHGNERVSQRFATDQALRLVEALAGGGGPMQNELMGLLGLGAQVGVLLPYSRMQEKEADKIGLDLMAKAGFDPREAVSLWQAMAKVSGNQPPELLSTHPAHDTRIKALRESMEHALSLYRRQGDPPSCQPPPAAGASLMPLVATAAPNG